jgi:acyl carrier protein
MELQSFITGFADQFEDIELGSIHANTDFKKMEKWDSLATMLVIGFISSEFKINLSKSDMDACTTVQDLFDFIKLK